MTDHERPAVGDRIQFVGFNAASYEDTGVVVENRGPYAIIEWDGLPGRRHGLHHSQVQRIDNPRLAIAGQILIEVLAQLEEPSDETAALTGGDADLLTFARDHAGTLLNAVVQRHEDALADAGVA